MYTASFDYACVLWRSHMLPQQELPSLCDIIEHLPSAQQLILPLLSFDIIGQLLPSLPWQQLPPLQHSASFEQQLAPLPQQAILPSA